MSQENVEILRAGIDAANRADFDSFASLMHPDGVWEVNDDGFPGLPGTYHGREGARRWIETTWEAWESVRIEVEEIVEPSDDCLVAGTLMIARGHESGAETRLLIWHLFFITDGLVARRVGPFWTKDAALEAAGLRE
jgi:ketosteroid isomerase-like protein